MLFTKKKQQKMTDIVENMKLTDKDSVAVDKTVIEVSGCIKNKNNCLGIKWNGIFFVLQWLYGHKLRF